MGPLESTLRVPLQDLTPARLHDWAAACDAAVAASRVRNALCARVTAATSTPLPKKPAPVNWPCAVASSTCCRE